MRSADPFVPVLTKFDADQVLKAGKIPILVRMPKFVRTSDRKVGRAARRRNAQIRRAFRAAQIVALHSAQARLRAADRERRRADRASRKQVDHG